MKSFVSKDQMQVDRPVVKLSLKKLLALEARLETKDEGLSAVISRMDSVGIDAFKTSSEWESMPGMLKMYVNLVLFLSEFWDACESEVREALFTDNKKDLSDVIESTAVVYLVDYFEEITEDGLLDYIFPEKVGLDDIQNYEGLDVSGSALIGVIVNGAATLDNVLGLFLNEVNNREDLMSLGVAQKKELLKSLFGGLATLSQSSSAVMLVTHGEVEIIKKSNSKGYLGIEVETLESPSFYMMGASSKFTCPSMQIPGFTKSLWNLLIDRLTDKDLA